MFPPSRGFHASPEGDNCDDPVRAFTHDCGGKGQRTTKVSSKNQITLPVAALRAANVGPGDVLRVEVVEDGVFRLVRHRDPWWDLFENLSSGASR